MASIVGAIAGPVIGGLIAGKSSKSTQQATQLADPFAAYRGMYGQQLNQYMQDPTSFIEKSPAYKFNYEQGLNALQRQMAAGSMSASGNAMIEAEKYGQNYAMGIGNNLFNELAQLSGASWNSGPQAAATMQAGQQMQGQAAGQIGGAIGSAISGYTSQNPNWFSNMTGSLFGGGSPQGYSGGSGGFDFGGSTYSG